MINFMQPNLFMTFCTTLKTMSRTFILLGAELQRMTKTDLTYAVAFS